VVALIEAKRDPVLKADVDRFVRLVDFKPGQITFAPAEGAPANLHHRLSTRLKEWTGQPWRMVIEGGGGVETQYEKDKREDAAFRAEASAHPLVLSMLEAFPGAEVVSVRKVTPSPPAAVAEVDSDDEE
jgi:DNA polymerase-3 subunit gamma/tau